MSYQACKVCRREADGVGLKLGAKGTGKPDENFHQDRDTFFSGFFFQQFWTSGSMVDVHKKLVQM